MADTAEGGSRRGPENAILVIVVLAVVALLVWFVLGQAGSRDEGVDIDINVPAEEGGRGAGSPTGSVP
jgi:hypothetical protein